METGCEICRLIADVSDPSDKRSLFKITEMEVSVAVLSSDQFFRGYTLVTYKEHATELYHLSPHKRIQFCEEMIRVANALDRALGPDKMNYELLGNAQPHMHWHLIPRYKNDRFWGLPVWIQRHDKKRLANREYQELIDKIKRYL
jgi:diadenosine tetraphosphate (Ap4A) HIT family hydrolase